MIQITKFIRIKTREIQTQLNSCIDLDTGGGAFNVAMFGFAKLLFESLCWSFMTKNMSNRLAADAAPSVATSLVY